VHRPSARSSSRVLDVATFEAPSRVAAGHVIHDEETRTIISGDRQVVVQKQLDGSTKYFSDHAFEAKDITDQRPHSRRPTSPRTL